MLLLVVITSNNNTITVFPGFELCECIFHSCLETVASNETTTKSSCKP